MGRDLEQEARAAARKSWPVRSFRLGEEPPDNLSATTTASERLDMVWQLTVDAWTLSGREIPDYPRSEAPVRIIRSGQEVETQDVQGLPRGTLPMSV